MTSQPLSVSSHTLYRQHHTHSFYDITLTICVASFALYKTWDPHFLSSNHHFENITPTILDIMSTVSVSSHQLYWWFHSPNMYDITSSTCEIFCPLYLWHHTHYVWQHNPMCWLHHTLHMCDIICATEDITSTLLHQVTIFMTSHPLQAWHHPPCIRHRTNCIFVITTSPLISHPLLYDITPTISVTSYALYITSYPLLLSSHYCTNDSKGLTYETTSRMKFKIYTIHVTSQSVVCVITPTVLRASHPLFVWPHTWHRCNIFCTIEDIKSSLYAIIPPFLWHHTHYIWYRIDAISVTTSTVLMTSHQLYLWDLILYICQNHIHYIQQHNHYICTITATVPVSHTHTFHDISPFVYMTSHAQYMIPQPLHLYGHTHAIDAITKIMEVIPLGTRMILYTLYITSHSPFMTSILGIYDITKHCIHDIRSPLYDITSTL